MKDADVDKLYDALRITTNIDAQLSNLLSRGARAGKFWTSWLKTAKPDATQVRQMKDALTALGKLLKDAKLVMKDLDKATKQAGDKATLAKYDTGAKYRDTVLTKQLASLKTFEQNGDKFITNMSAIVSPFPFPKSPDSLADVTVTYDSVKNYLHHYGEMKKLLAKV